MYAKTSDLYINKGWALKNPKFTELVSLEWKTIQLMTSFWQKNKKNQVTKTQQTIKTVKKREN